MKKFLFVLFALPVLAFEAPIPEQSEDFFDKSTGIYRQRVWHCAAVDAYYERHVGAHWGWGVTAPIAAQYALVDCQIYHGADCRLAGCRWSVR